MIFTVFLLISIQITLGVPGSLNFGGLFETFDTNNDGSITIVQSGIQRKAAFLMAVNEINNKTDGIVDSLLPNHTINIYVLNSEAQNYFSTIQNSYTLLSYSNYDLHVQIGPSGDVAMADTTGLFQDFQVLQIGYDTMSTKFDDKFAYPYFARTCPHESYEGIVLAEIMALYFNWFRVITFSSTDSYGSSLLEEFTYEANDYEIQIIQSQTFRAGHTDYTSVINAAMNQGVYIFVLLMSAHDAGLLLEQGYKLGLFSSSTQILGTSATVSAATWKVMSSKADVTAIMKGYLAVTPTTAYHTPEGFGFVSRWRKQPSTAPYVQNGETYCVLGDDAIGDPLYYNYDYNSGIYTCLGQDFHAFHKNGSNIDKFVPYVYDAVYAAAFAYHNLLYEEMVPLSGISGPVLLDSLAYNVSFDGATGYINFANGKGEDGLYRGERETDNSYYIVNFHADSFSRLRNGTGMVPVLKWNSDSEFVPCTGCSSILYRTSDNSVPYDRTPLTVISLTNTQKAALLALSILAAVIVLIFWSVVVVCGSNRIIRASQPTMLHLMFLGGLLGCGQIFLSTAPKTSNATCILGIWFSHLAFGFAFSALLTKTWVIHKIVNSRQRKVRIKTTDALINVMIAMAILVILLFVITFIEKPSVSTIVTNDVNKPLKYYYCRHASSTITSILYVIEILSLLVGLRLCWAIKSVPDALNEAKFIFSAVGVVVIVSAVCGVLKFFGNYDVVQQTFALDIGFAVAVSLCTVLLFGQKAYLLGIGAEFDGQLRIKNKKVVAVDVQELVDKDGGAFDNLSIGPKLCPVEDANETLRAGTKDGNKKLCEEQIQAGIALEELCDKHAQEWSALLNAIETDTFDSFIASLAISSSIKDGRKEAFGESKGASQH